MKAKLTTRNQSGFSLLEILVAMAIMAILGGVMVVQYMDYAEEATFQRLKADFAAIDSALIRYHADNFSFPTTEQGLEALVTKPEISPRPRNYRRNGYLQKLSIDPWGNAYQYNYPGEFSAYDIYSLGRDGEVGGEGVDADVGNWNIDDVVFALKDRK